MTLNKQELLVSGLHTLEIVLCIVASFLILRFVGMESEFKTLIGTVVLAFVAKLLRESSSIPVSDWVNAPFTKATQKPK
jgi:hypothetical protein